MAFAAGDTMLLNKATLAFGTAGGVDSVEILSIDWSGIERATVGTAHIGQTGGQKKIGSEWYDAGTLTVDAHFNDTSKEVFTDLVANSPSALTLTFFQTGVTSGATWVAAALLKSVSLSGSLDDKVTWSLVFDISGSITMTDAV